MSKISDLRKVLKTVGGTSVAYTFVPPLVQSVVTLVQSVFRMPETTAAFDLNAFGNDTLGFSVGGSVLFAILDQLAGGTLSSSTESGDGGGGPSKSGVIRDRDGNEIGSFDIYDNNAVPYSCVEKKASLIADTISGQINHDFPAVVAESRDAYHAAQSVLGSGVGSALETLAVLEKVLRA